MARELATIGVFGFDAEGFVAALREAGAVELLDLRARRGVRGAQYAWANSRRLQNLLAAAGIGYRHLPALAPSAELRQAQHGEDERQRVGKRSRIALAPAFVERYTREVLDRADLDAVAAALPAGGVAALLCVERDAAACHRSLVAAALAERHGLRVRDLVPAG